MPAAIAVVGVVATVAATAYSAYSQHQQGKAQQKLNEYNAKVAENEAFAIERDAAAAAREASLQGMREAEALAGRQRALYAAAGVDINSGSPLLVQAEGYGNAAISAANAGGAIIGPAQSQASALRQQAVMDRFAGRTARATARANVIGTSIAGAASALRGGTAVAKQYF
ncbi:MAG: hypothetical protein LBR07_04465 [Puniceicoccales bacterium]|jgi:hypothetical protein|nr:hypothetical protein [Puniceicoccales bacterium]